MPCRSIDAEPTRQDRPRRGHPLPADLRRLDPGRVPAGAGPDRPDLHRRPRRRHPDRPRARFLDLVNALAVHRHRGRPVLDRQAPARGPRPRLRRHAAVRGRRDRRSASSACSPSSPCARRLPPAPDATASSPSGRASSPSATGRSSLGPGMAGLNALMLGHAAVPLPARAAGHPGARPDRRPHLLLGRARDRRRPRRAVRLVPPRGPVDVRVGVAVRPADDLQGLQPERTDRGFGDRRSGGRASSPGGCEHCDPANGVGRRIDLIRPRRERNDERDHLRQLRFPRRPGAS